MPLVQDYARPVDQEPSVLLSPQKRVKDITENKIYRRQKRLKKKEICRREKERRKEKANEREKEEHIN